MWWTRNVVFTRDEWKQVIDTVGDVGKFADAWTQHLAALLNQMQPRSEVTGLLKRMVAEKAGERV